MYIFDSKLYHNAVLQSERSVLPKYLIFSVHPTFHPLFQEQPDLFRKLDTLYSTSAKTLLIRYEEEVLQGFHATCMKLYLKT